MFRKNGISRVAIAASLAMLGGSFAAPVATVASPTIDNQGNSVHQSKNAMNRKTSSLVINKVAAIRSTGNRYYGYRWLTPVKKESFKQSRRKQLKLRSKKKAKRNGQA